MMRFLLSLEQLNPSVMNLRINETVSSAESTKPLLKIDYNIPEEYRNYKNDRFDLFVLGDLLIPDNIKEDRFFSNLLSTPLESVLKELKGHFYLILLDKSKQQLFCASSMFSILPVYIYHKKDNLVVSSSIEMIKDFTGNSFELNRKFILEKLLFNYSFLNETVHKEITLLPSNNYIRIGNKTELVKHTNIQDFYINNPVNSKKALDDISSLFLEQFNAYIPSNDFYITFTGGFDGRTLVAAALNKKYDFKTFSYGAQNDKDIQVPGDIAASLGLYHKKFILDEVYSKRYYKLSLENLIQQTDCNGGINRSHYSYIASELSKSINYFISGNFGSELIRTMRIAGVMTSQFLITLFNSEDESLLQKELLNQKCLRYFDPEIIRDELNAIFHDIITYKTNLNSELTLNQKFYVYLFEEVFRKFFGPELIIQNYFGVHNRTPYLDFQFIKELLKTELAGVSGRYLERNPLLRFKGQILYSFILKKLGSSLLNYPTDRGYKPEDFFSLKGKLNIAKHYINNRFIDKEDKSYTSYNDLCFRNNRDYFISLKSPAGLKMDSINLDNIGFSDELSNLLSVQVYFNKMTLEVH